MGSSPIASWGMMIGLWSLAFLRWRSVRSLLEPGAFFCFVWAIISVAHLVGAPTYSISPTAMLWLGTSALMVMGGATLAQLRRDTRPLEGSRGTTVRLKLRYLDILLLGALCLGSIYTPLRLLASGYSLGVLTDAQELASTANLISADRYANIERPSLVVQMFLIPTYLSAILGGMRFATRERKRDVITAMSSLVPAFLIFLVHTMRAALLFGAVLWIGGYLAAAASQGASLRLGKRHVFALFLAVCIAPIALSVGESLRNGRLPRLQDVTEGFGSPRTRIYCFGALPAFSTWLEARDHSHQELELGRRSLSGLFDVLGLQSRELGLYSEPVHLAEGEMTNVFTYHRELIDDFGVVGGGLIFALIGAAAGISYQRARGGARPGAVLITYYAGTLCFVSSVLTYNGCLFALILAAVYLVYFTTTEPEP